MTSSRGRDAGWRIIAVLAVCLAAGAGFGQEEDYNDTSADDTDAQEEQTYEEPAPVEPTPPPPAPGPSEQDLQLERERAATADGAWTSSDNDSNKSSAGGSKTVRESGGAAEPPPWESAEPVVPEADSAAPTPDISPSVAAFTLGTLLLVMIVLFVFNVWAVGFVALKLHVYEAGYVKAFLAVFAENVGCIPAILVMNMLGFPILVGWAIVIVAVPILVIKWVFACEWGQALAVWLVSTAIQFVVLVLLGVLGLFSLGALLHGA